MYGSTQSKRPMDILLPLFFVVSNCPCLQFKAKTKDPNLRPDRQAKATMAANPYNTKGKNYIHIGAQPPQKHDVTSCCLSHTSSDCHSLRACFLQGWIQLSWN